jgi:hypothetical protein
MCGRRGRDAVWKDEEGMMSGLIRRGDVPETEEGMF